MATRLGLMQCPRDAPVQRWIDKIDALPSANPIFGGGSGYMFSLCPDHAAMWDSETKESRP